MTDDQRSPAPAGKPPSNRTALLLGIAPAIVVAIALAVGIAFFNDPEANRPQPAADAEQTASAEGAPVEDQITVTMQRYVDALVDGDATLFKSTLCQQVVAKTLEFQDSPPLEEDLPQLDDVTVLSSTDSSATATVTVSVKGLPEYGSKTTQLQFVNEDGWKLC